VNILFRCDGSFDIGMGHLMRCLTLADYLKNEYKCSIRFAIRFSDLAIKKVENKYPTFKSDESFFDYYKWLYDIIILTKTNILIMDMRDGLKRKELFLLKKNTGVKVVTIDDPENKRCEADLAFYPPVPQLKKMNWDGFFGKVFVGWKYVIVRDEFMHKYPSANNSKPNILVSMGATDKSNMTKFVFDVLNKIKHKFVVTAILGAGYKLKEQNNIFSKEVHHFEYDIHYNPDNVANIMSSTDLAIISFGQTAYEIAALNIPAIYLCLTDDHNLSSKIFANKNLGKSAGVFDNNREETEKNLEKYLNMFLCNFPPKKARKINFDLKNISKPIMSILS